MLGLVAARFTHLFPNRNQWRATTLAADNADKLAGDAGTPCYVRTGYPDATDQTWQPADPDNLYMQFAAGDPVLIAGEGPETDTLRLNYGNTSPLQGPAPDSPVRAPPTPRPSRSTRACSSSRAIGLVQCGDANIYVLSDDGSRFELKDRVTLRPFESYVVANAATQALLKSLRLDGIVTGTELAEIPADNSFRAWTATDVCTLAPTMREGGRIPRQRDLEVLSAALARRDDDRPSFRHLSRPPRRYNDQGRPVEHTLYYIH